MFLPDGQFTHASHAQFARRANVPHEQRLRCRANQRFNFACLTADEGRIAIVTNVAVRCGGRECLRKTNAALADGEVVWSWRPKAGAKWRRCFRIAPATVATKPGHRGEHV